jgi:hypothetical protein
MKKTPSRGYVKTSSRILKQPAKGPVKAIWTGVKPVGPRQ